MIRKLRKRFVRMAVLVLTAAMVLVVGIVNTANLLIVRGELSGTVKELAKGTHFIGKKIAEEAGEVWIASEYEGRERTAEEISQLLYHLQVMMIDRKLELEDIYRYL